MPSKSLPSNSPRLQAATTGGTGPESPIRRATSIVERPVFLVGAERSGTTLLRLMLDHHPKVAFLPEFGFDIPFIKGIPEFPDPNEYFSSEEVRRVIQDDWHLDLDVLDSFPETVNALLVQKREISQKEAVGATVHYTFSWLCHVWPDACFIHLIRDPRDVARSCIQMGWAGNTYVALDRWLRAEQLWEDFRDTIDSTRWIEVRYEDLIRNPDDVLASICKFIGVEFDAAMYDYERTSTYSRPDPQLTEQWRKKLSNHDIQLAEARLGPWLEKRGYQSSGLSSLQVNHIHEWALRTQSKWSLRFRRISRLGLSLAAAEFMSRRLPGRPFRNYVANQMYELHKKARK